MAVPAGLIAERRLITRLMHADAMSAQNAQQLEGLTWIQARRLSRLLNKGVIQQPQPGRYYLNAPALADHINGHRHRAAILLVIVVLLMGLTMYWIPSNRF